VGGSVGKEEGHDRRKEEGGRRKEVMHFYLLSPISSLLFILS
jgi:hypothetical protein